MMECEILVVDDDQELAETLCDFLEGEGFAVTTAPCGAPQP